jgi:hypothetical protein
VSYNLDCRQNGATLTLASRWKENAVPTAIVFHIPWFLKAISAKVDGNPASITGNAISLPPNARKVEVRWSRSAEPNLSYEEAVRLYLEKFYRRPAGADYDFLFPVIRSPEAGTGK